MIRMACTMESYSIITKGQDLIWYTSYYNVYSVTGSSSNYLSLAVSAAGDILDGNMDKTLQLVWLLILHYHIDCRSQQNSSDPALQRKNKCKQSMLVWVNAVLPGKNITNFTTDWTSGENLAALINFCQPGLISVQPKCRHPYERLSQAIQVAQKAFNIPAVLSADDLFVDQPDEVSVMVYLSYFCRVGSPGERALLQWVQQVIPSQNISNLTTDWVSGVNLGALINKLTHNGFPEFKKFSSTSPLANTQQSMTKAEELLKIPSSVSVESLSSDNLGYLAKLAYLIQFYAAQKGEPVVMKVDISKVQVSPINRGKEKGRKVVWMDVDCSNAGTAEIKVVVCTEAGKEINASVTEMSDGEDQYRIKFVVEEGVMVYTVSITYGGQEVSGSPFHVNLADADATKVETLETETSTEWTDSMSVVLGFDTKEAGYGKLTAKASGESAGSVPVQLVPKPQGGFDVVFIPPIPDIYLVDVQWGRFMALAKGYSCGTIPIEFQQDSKRDFKLAFEPPTPDVYTVDVMWGGEPVPGSPFTINLLPPAQPENVETGDPMFGDVGENVVLPVDLTHAGPGDLTATCTGEKVGKVETTVLSISKKLYQVTFLATEIDIYHLGVFFNGVHIKGSPFRIDLGQKQSNIIPQLHDLPQVQIFTINMLSSGKKRVSVDPVPEVLKCYVGQALLLRFSVSSDDGILTKAARAVMSLFVDRVKATAVGEITGPAGTKVEHPSSGVYEVIFAPTKSDTYTLSIQYEGDEILQQPFRAIFEEPMNSPKKVVVSGVDKHDFYVNQEFKFEIKTLGAGIGPLKVKVQVPGIDGTRQIRANEEGSNCYVVRYLPSITGKYLLYLFWGDVAIPSSPVSITVKDLPVVPQGQPACYEIPVGKWKLSDIESIGTHLESGKGYEVKGTKKRSKYIFTLTPDEPGTYEIVLRVDGKQICRPFYFKFERQSYPDKVVMFDSVTEGRVNEVLRLKFDVSDAGKGRLNFYPKRQAKKVSFKNGIYIIKFSASSPGEYPLKITWNGEEVPLSPIIIRIRIGGTETDEIEPGLSSPKHDPKTPVHPKGDKKEPHRQKGREKSSTKEDEAVDEEEHTEDDKDSDDDDEKSLKDDATIDVIDDLENIPTGEIIRRLIRWPIDLSEHEGKLEVTAVGDKTGRAEILLTQVQERVYQVIFRPTKSDRYTISILLNGKHVANSPRIITYEVPETNVKEIKIDGWSKIPSVIAVGQTIHFVVNTQDAGLGELKVNPKTPKSKTETHTLEIDEHDNNPAMYTVSYTPLAVGVHSLELLFSQIPVPGTPLQLTVCDPQAVGFTHATQKLVKIGQLITMEVDTSKAGCDELTATCEGTKSGKVSVSISSTKVKGKFEISFKPLIEDLYTLVVKLGKYHIKGSPFRFNLNSIPVEKAIVTGPQLLDGPGGPFKLTVNTSGLPKGKLESYCKFGERTISVQVKEVSPGVFSLVFEPEEPALHVWSVLFHGQHVPGSPFQIDVRPQANKAVVVAPETGSVRIGQYVSYEIDMSGAGMGTLTATCRGEISKKKVPVQITQVRQNVYRISFLPLSFDRYTLYIQWSGIEIPNSPFVFDLKPPNPRDIGKDPTEIPFVLPSIEDISAVKVTCTGLKYGVIAVNLVPVSANNYRITFKPQGPDLYTISVLYNGVHVKGSPFTLDLRVLKEETIRQEDIDYVVPPQQPGQDTHREYRMVIGKAFIVLIELQGKQPKAIGEIKATAVGRKTGETITHVDQYSRRVIFNPKTADTYTLNISYNGNPVSQSPFTVHYSDPPSDPSKVKVIGLEDLLSVLDINKEVSLVINAMKGGSGTLRAEVRGPKETKVEVQARDGEQGTYTVSFLPTSAGLYILSLFWNGQHIPNSPLKIRVVDTSSSVKTLPGKKVTINDMEIKCGPTEIQAYALRRDSTKKLKVTVKQIKTHLYRLIFSHKEPGHYFIHIFVNGEELDVSPIPVYISQPSWPKKCRVHNLPMVGYLNEEISMTINCAEGGEGTLEAKVIEPNKSESTLAIVNNEDGTFTIAYVPTIEGTYTFNITWSGQDIPGSPYQLIVKKPTNENPPISEVSSIDLTDQSHPFTGGNQMNISMNSYFMFSVRLTKKQARSFIARAISENGNYFDLSLISTTGNLFKYSFKPPNPGQYTLEFSLGDIKLNLPQLPTVLIFSEAEIDAKKVKILTHTISGLLLIDRQIFFQIDSRLAGNGKITANLECPSGDAPDLRIVPTQDKPHFYDIFFTPLVAGTYHLKLLWGGTMMPGFPFNFHVREPIIKYGETSSFEMQVDSHIKYISSFASHVETGEKYEVEIHQESKRRYRFEFHPKISGRYNLHVLVNGKDISGSSFQLTYDHPPQPENVIIKNLPKKAQVDSEVKFFINTQRAGSGHLNINITGPESTEIQLTEFLTGAYKAEFIPNTTGVYTIEIIWSGKQVPNSPFELTVTDILPEQQLFPISPPIVGPGGTPPIPEIIGPPDIVNPEHSAPPPPPPSIIESDLIIFGKTHTLGKLSFSIIHNGFLDLLEIRFTGSTELPFRVIKGQRANKYEIDPKVAGKYEMVILWGGSIVGEVYTLFFESPKTITGLNLQDQVFQVGKSYQFTITTEEISTGLMEINCVPHDAADIVCKAITSTQYQCSLVPKMVGEVKIAVFFNGLQIQGSPFVVQFKAATAFNCKFGLQSEGIEINDISAVLESIATQQPIPLSLQQLFGGECNLDFVPTEGDEYKLIITCGLKIKRETMAGSPFNLTYLTGQGGASMCRIEGGIPGGVVGEWSKFVVNCEGAGAGKLTAEISGEGAEVKIVSISKYMYEVQYRISAGGIYRFRLLWGGQDIPGSPFNITVQSTSSSTSSVSVKVSNVPQKVAVKKPIEFELHIQGSGNEGDLTVETTTPSGRQLNGSVVPRKHGYHVSIPTNEIGYYAISINYMGKALLQPLKVQVIQQGEFMHMRHIILTCH